ncbi:MAG TPA: cache domain-containing protein [Anaerolineales bacterium]|nr:cache domain-containing protein [Anaerolineales bacterium]
MFRKVFASLRARLILLVLLAVIPALGLILYSGAEQRRLAAENTRADALSLARLLAADHTRFIEETRQLLLTLAHLTEVREENSSACDQLFSGLLDQYPQYTNLGVISLEGNAYCSAVPIHRTVNLADRGYFQRAIENNDFAIGNYQIDEITGSPAINFGYPVRDEAGKVQSVVFASLNLNWLDRLVTQSQLPDGAALIMLDSNSTVLVYYPNPQQWVGKSLPDQPLVKAILSEGIGTMSLPGLDGIERLYAFVPLSSNYGDRFFIGVGLSEEIAFAMANQILVRQFIGLTAVFILALAAAWIGSDLFILRRLHAILAATKKLESGDLEVRTGLPYGQGELSQLARAFDQMAGALRQRETEHRRAQEEIMHHNRDLTALNTITAAVSSSLELPEVLESLKQLLEEQLNVPGGIIYFYDEFDDSLYVEAAWGVPATILAEFKRLSADTLHYEQVIRNKESVLRPDLDQVIPFHVLGLKQYRPKWKSYLCVPLVAKGGVQGVLDLFSQTPTEFTVEHVALFTSLGLQVGVAIQNARLFEQIWAGRRRLQMLSQELLEVQEAERLHISRELHDEVGQALTAVKVNLQAASRLADSSSLTPYLEESIGVVERTLDQVRNLSLDLRPSMLDDLGVLAAVRWYLDRQAKRAGFRAHFAADMPDVRLSSDLETTCFRVVQEALTNAVRHSQAQNVWVTIQQCDSELELVIRDDGVGFDVSSVMKRGAGDLSLGLLGMQERVELTGGKIQIKSDPERGTEIRALFPLTRLVQSEPDFEARI